MKNEKTVQQTDGLLWHRLGLFILYIFRKLYIGGEMKRILFWASTASTLSLCSCWVSHLCISSPVTVNGDPDQFTASLLGRRCWLPPEVPQGFLLLLAAGLEAYRPPKVQWDICHAMQISWLVKWHVTYQMLTLHPLKVEDTALTRT